MLTVRTLSQLPELRQSPTEQSYIEISKSIRQGNIAQHYVSQKMTLQSFYSKVNEIVVNKLSEDYNLVKVNGSIDPAFSLNDKYDSAFLGKTNLKAIAKGLYDLYESDVNITGGVKTFYKRPKIKALLSTKLDELTGPNNVVDIKLLSAYNSQNTLGLTNLSFDFSTYYFNPEVEDGLSGKSNVVTFPNSRENIAGTENIRAGTLYSHKAGSNNQFGLSEGEIKENHSNEWIFRIPDNSRQSNNWVAPASGMFTCFGWLDEKDGSYANNALRWVALEAWNDIKKEWYILQLQPFSPNNFCSYVGFSFPVKAGLLMRIRTGFAVGTNSDKYFTLVGSLTNHIANAFIGGVYNLDSSVQYIPNNANSFNYYDDVLNTWKRYQPTNRQTLDLLCQLSSSLSGRFNGVYLDLLNPEESKRSFQTNIELGINTWKEESNIHQYVDLGSRNTLSSLIVHSMNSLTGNSTCGFGKINTSSYIKNLYFYRVKNTGTINFTVTSDFEGDRTIVDTYLVVANKLASGTTSYELKRINKQVEENSGMETTETFSLPLKDGNIIAFQCVRPTDYQAVANSISPNAETQSMYKYYDPNNTEVTPNTNGTFPCFVKINEFYNLTDDERDDQDFYAQIPEVDGPVEPVQPADAINYMDYINQLSALVKNLQTTTQTINNNLILSSNTLVQRLTGKVDFYNGRVSHQWYIATLPVSTRTYDSMTINADGGMPYANDTKYPGTTYTNCRRIAGGDYEFKVPENGTYMIKLDPENSSGTYTGEANNKWSQGITMLWMRSIKANGENGITYRTRNKSSSTWNAWTENYRYNYSLIANTAEIFSGADPVTTVTLNLAKGTVLIFNQLNVYHSGGLEDWRTLTGGDVMPGPQGIINVKDMWRYRHYSSQEIQWYQTQGNSTTRATGSNNTKEDGWLNSSSVHIVTTSHRTGNRLNNRVIASIQKLA